MKTNGPFLLKFDIDIFACLRKRMTATRDLRRFRHFTPIMVYGTVGIKSTLKLLLQHTKIHNQVVVSTKGNEVKGNLSENEQNNPQQNLPRPELNSVDQQCLPRPKLNNMDLQCLPRPELKHFEGKPELS